MKKCWEICTNFDPFVRSGLTERLMISWTGVLSNGLTVYGDYERPEFAPCWERVQKYCVENSCHFTKVQLHMFGMPEAVFFEDENGLDGLSICRGSAREQSMSGHSKDFQFLTVSLLDEGCDYIDVRKFVWPENDYEQLESKRLLTRNNIKQMVFKSDSKKINNEKVFKHLDR
jgi:hypothetical protein